MRNRLLLFRAFLGLVVLFSVLAYPAWGQVLNTRSPYSQYGLGLPLKQGYNRGLAMGGASLTLRDGNMINAENPASYPMQDSLSFLFDVGLFGRYEHLQIPSSGEARHGGSGMIHHAAIQFPVGRWFGMAAGFQPFTQVGYDVTRYEQDKRIVSDVARVRYQHKGHGGTNLAFLGVGAGPFAGVTLGLNFQYIFGSLNAEQNIYFPNETRYADIHYVRRTVVRGLGLVPGVQYTYAWKDSARRTHRVTAAMTAEIVPYLQGDVRMEADMTLLNRKIAFLDNHSVGRSLIRYPVKYRLGMSYEIEHLTVALDGAYQGWEGFTMNGMPGTDYGSQYQVHLGLQYTPDPYSLRYYGRRMSYRLGGYLYRLPYRMDGAGIYDVGMSLGFGFPFRWSKTGFHVTVVAGRRAAFDQGPLTEHYVQLVLGASLNDFWFFKRRYD